MTEPIDVVLNTPKRTGPELVLLLAGRVTNLLVVSWVVMLLLGTLTPIAPGYLTVVGLVWIYRAVQNPSLPTGLVRVPSRN